MKERYSISDKPGDLALKKKVSSDVDEWLEDNDPTPIPFGVSGRDKKQEPEGWNNSSGEAAAARLRRQRAKK